MPLKLKKYDAITSLDAAHPLYSKVNRFILFDTTIRDLKSGQVYTTSAGIAAGNEPLGSNIRQFDSSDDVLSPAVPLPFPCTLLMVYRQYGNNSGGGSDTTMFQAVDGGDWLSLNAGSWSIYDYRYDRRGSYGPIAYTYFKPYRVGISDADESTRAERRQKAHCTAIDYVSGNTSFWQDGVQHLPVSGAAAPIFTPSTNPVPVIFSQSVAAGKEWNVAAIVVFNSVLTDEEKAAITQEPWELTNGTVPLDASIDVSLTPGALVTATLLNYIVDPTNVTVMDSRGNSITLPLTPIGNNKHTFTIPALAATAEGIPYLLTGNVSLNFGGKAIPSVFSVVTPNESITLLHPVATSIFEGWGVDTPVAGEQLISQGNFDFNGNFTADQINTSYNCWITKLDGSNHHFTVQLSIIGDPVSLDVNNVTVNVVPGNNSVQAGVNIVANNVTIPVTPRQNSVTTTALMQTQNLGNSPKWSAFKGISKYPTPDIAVTAPPMTGVIAVVSGPYGVGDSRGRLDARRWAVGQSNGKIVIRYSKG